MEQVAGRINGLQLGTGSTIGAGKHDVRVYCRDDESNRRLNKRFDLMAIMPDSTAKERERVYRRYMWANGFHWEFRTVGAGKRLGIFSKGYYCVGKVNGVKQVVSRSIR